MDTVYLILFEDQISNNHKLINFAHHNLPDIKLTGVFIGSNTDEATQNYGQTGLNQLEVITYDDYSSLNRGRTVDVLSEYFKDKLTNSLVLVANLHSTSGVATRLAAKLHRLLLTRVLNVKVANDQIISQKKVYSGGLIQQDTVQIEKGILATCDLTGVSEQTTGISPEITTHTVDASDLKTTAVFEANPVTTGQDIESANVVVAGGRGLKNADNFKQIEALAAAVSGGVGASRAAVDAGWVANTAMVGQSGKTIAPELYLAIGISGTVQHTVGMDQSRCIVAINTDAEAPIFKLADYGIVGDANTVIQQLIEELPVVVPN